MGFKGVMEWLGLSNSDDRYDYEETSMEETGEVYDEMELEPSVVTPISERRRSRESHYDDESQPQQSQVRAADLDRIIKINPRTYNEARTIGEHFRNHVPVIMNLSEMEHDEAKRLIDFASGLVFGLNGSIERVTSKVFLLTPHNVAVADEDKARFASSGGFFNQS